MTQDPPAQTAWSFDDMLESFRALGGAVRNLRLGNEGTETGLYVVDPREPVLLRVPRNLLLRVEDLEFSAGRLCIRQTADAGHLERIFFDRYQDAFSWGAAGHPEGAAFVGALDALPIELRQLLCAELGFTELLQDNFEERVQARFLRSRQISWQETNFIAPLLELARHNISGLRYEHGTHLQVQGYVRGELQIRHGANDPLSTFRLFGCATREPVAFSLPMDATFGNLKVSIGRNPNAGTMRGKDRIPQTRAGQGTMELSYLLIGHRKNPRAPRGTFRTLLREAGMKDPDEAFDTIVRFNALAFIKLLRALEPHEGEMISLLRTMARCQLEAISHCIGSRELAPVTSE
ncbi:MAG TPA: hypothetical protein VGI20_15625 [Rhizomicrobium sp.]|jgi:hypothetical protein